MRKCSVEAPGNTIIEHSEVKMKAYDKCCSDFHLAKNIKVVCCLPCSMSNKTSSALKYSF